MANIDFSKSTFDEVTRAFSDPDQHESLRQVFGDEEFEEILEIRQRQLSFAPMFGGKRMVILPGIMGSVLTDTAGVRGDLWPSLGMLVALDFNALELAGDGGRDLFLDVKVEARTLIPFCYYKLYSYFQKKGYVVTQCAFDWRRTIDSSAHSLHRHISQFAQASAEQPEFVLVAHSMGGLVARRYFDLFPEHAKQNVEHLYMLGTPNHGSYAPAMAFSGQHSIVNAVGWKLGANIARAIVATFPGLYEMFPHPDVFGQAEIFQQRFFGSEPVSQSHLDGALRFQQTPKFTDRDKMTVFATRTEKTVVSAAVEADGTCKFLAAKAGDGTVPVRSAHLPGVKTYLASAAHAWIPRETKVMQAIYELASSGSCDLDEHQPAFGSSDEDIDALEEVPRDSAAFQI